MSGVSTEILDDSLFRAEWLAREVSWALRRDRPAFPDEFVLFPLVKRIEDRWAARRARRAARRVCDCEGEW